jgi:hypothetical protein
MPLVIVGRTLDRPTDFAELQAMETASAWCLDVNGVTFKHSYLSSDRTRMICVYDAPDAESVRRSQRTAGLPFERAWTADVFPVSHGEG